MVRGVCEITLRVASQKYGGTKNNRGAQYEFACPTLGFPYVAMLFQHTQPYPIRPWLVDFQRLIRVLSVVYAQITIQITMFMTPLFHLPRES